jgi:hypothetical protein
MNKEKKEKEKMVEKRKNKRRKSLCVGRTQTKCMKRSICKLTNAGKKKSYCRAKKNRRTRRTKKRRVQEEDEYRYFNA